MEKRDRDMSEHLPETVLQFGTGKFLRCFADLIIHEANQGSQPIGRVVALQSTGGQRARLLNAQAGRYHVAVRGLDHDGQRIDRTVALDGVSRALVAADDWQQVLTLARCEALQIVISNTTEAGYALQPEQPAAAGTPRSFPAKLLRLLHARHESGGCGVTILPCELLDANAEGLLDLVLDQARRWRLPDSLTDWIRSECSWHNTLVDRIVWEPSPGEPLAAEDPLFAVAEPFALWLIEGTPAVPGLTTHPAVQLVDRLEPYCLRKVRILNGAHTALVAKALPLGIETVREAIKDARVGAWLNALLFAEIVPTLEGRTEDPEQFARETLQRFANPYMEHRLRDIALHHDVKLTTRLLPTYREYRERFGRAPKLLDEILGPG